MHRSTPPRLTVRGTVAALAVVLVGALGACTDDDTTSDPAPGDAPVDCVPPDVPDALEPAEVAEADVDGSTVSIATHDSFAVSDEVWAAFEEETGITVQVVPIGDAGTLVSQAVLTAGDPVADVMYGIDTTLLCRGLEAGLFTPYRADGLDAVRDDVDPVPHDLATPVDLGDVCLNVSRAAYPEPADGPQDLDDLVDERFADAFVTENPETSSPGLAFLLATIASYGEDGWEEYWQQLRDNGVEVTSGWTEAYEGSFGSGTGERSIVTSYATSPVADVVYSDPPRDEPAIDVVPDACFRQVEYAGILHGTENPEAAARLLDFLLSPTFQEDIPLSMFVEPVSTEAELPAVFEEARTPVDDPITMDPAEIEAGRDRWTERWTEIVLR